MAKTEMIRARVEPELKREAEETFSTLGLSPTEAITLFYKQVALHRGLPFAVRVPNAATAEEIRQARAGEVTEYESLDALAEAAGHADADASQQADDGGGATVVHIPHEPRSEEELLERIRKRGDAIRARGGIDLSPECIEELIQEGRRR